MFTTDEAWKQVQALVVTTILDEASVIPRIRVCRMTGR